MARRRKPPRRLPALPSPMLKRVETGPDGHEYEVRPIAAARDVLVDESGPRREIAQTVFESYAPQLDLSFAAAIYGLAGLFLGSLIGELVTAALAPRRHRRAI